MTTGVTLSESATHQLRRLAEASGVTAEELAEQAIRQFLRDEIGRALQRESAAFQAMHSDLLLNYAGEFVAVYGGQVIDHDVNQLALVLRIEDHYRDAPVLIKQVTPEIDEVYHVRSPRLITLNGPAGAAEPAK
ncbi:MAG: ribbon-helix-helix protein, CopG family [Chloroflexi bacterium]|nr:ribbon-helix-helix protein, CopG family [Chloroflexota bacterium]